MNNIIGNIIDINNPIPSIENTIIKWNNKNQDIQNIKINEIIKFKIILKNIKNEKKLFEKENIQIIFESKQDDIKTEIEKEKNIIFLIKENKEKCNYEISFNPTKYNIGNYNILIKYKNENIIKNSNFISIKIIQTTNNINFIKSLNQEGKSNAFICLYNDIIYVSRIEEKTISLFEKNGKLKQILTLDFNPTGISVYLNYIYVGDFTNKCIKVLNESGTIINQFGNDYITNPQFLFIYNDFVYVSDWDTHQILIFHTNGQFHYKFGTNGDKNGEFNGPQGIAVDPITNYIYVSDCSNHRIQVFDKNGIFQFKWGSKGSNEGQFDGPCGIFIDEFRVYVCDGTNCRIQIFDKNGKYLESFGKKGNGGGEFVGATYSILVDTDNIWITEWGGQCRIHQFQLC